MLGQFGGGLLLFFSNLKILELKLLCLVNRNVTKNFRAIYNFLSMLLSNANFDLKLWNVLAEGFKWFKQKSV